MAILRTPEARFDGLVGPTFARRFVELDGGLQMATIDARPNDGAEPSNVVLLLHGEPTWSFLYRKMIPILTDAGFRVIAPDLIGFGRSDKPTEPDVYTYRSHLAWLKQFIERVELTEVTLFCQDWGGLLGLRLVAELPNLFSRVVASNTFLPTGSEKVSKAFLQWQQFSQSVPELPISKIVQLGCVREVAADVLTAYDAPFPDESYKVGARRFPMLVPTDASSPDGLENAQAWKSLELFDKPFLTLFSDGDPITRGADRILQARIPGAIGQPHVVITNAGHFIQEDAGETLAAAMVPWMMGRSTV